VRDRRIGGIERKGDQDGRAYRDCRGELSSRTRTVHDESVPSQLTARLRTRLLVTQRHERVNFGGAQRRNECREQGTSGQRHYS
jgi:hypothetical protein